MGSIEILGFSDKEKYKLVCIRDKKEIAEDTFVKYKIIDLFAGIGGIRLGFERMGKFISVYSNDNDKYACDTYDMNFKGEIDRRNIWEVLATNRIPSFDVLLAGFPCQAFSIAGNKKGFYDERGTLFFAVEKIIDRYRPKAFLLENVKNLKSHDEGMTFKVIMDILQNKLGYHVNYAILNSSNFGVPQKRERIYIVGFRKKTAFEFPEGNKFTKGIKAILEKKVDNKYYLSETYLKGLKRHRERHERKGHGFGYNVLERNRNAFALVCGGMGRERNLVKDRRPKERYKYTNGKIKLNGEGIRKLTPRECARLQGFPDSFKLNKSDTQAYKQISNSVTVNVIEAIAKRIYKTMEDI